MRNYKLIIEYDGKNFCGWQKQLNTSNTVQEQIESAVEKIIREKIKLVGAGRTDSGVSAFGQVANFKTGTEIDLNGLLYSLNSILPESITIKKISEVNERFHSRYSAKKRQYIYKISIGKKSVSADYYFRINHVPDFEKIEAYIEFILKLKYFKSLCRNKEDRNGYLCDIFEFKYNYIKNKNELIFKISANRFLHSMVRAVLGLALDIGRGKTELAKAEEKILKGERVAIPYLPANALFLNKIYY